MSEYIVELDSKRSTALGLAFAEEMRGGDFVRGEIVRCADCKHYNPELYNNISCEWFMFDVEPDGFCAWGERRWTICKCGEEIELGNREYAICPSCGRMVRE